MVLNHNVRLPSDILLFIFLYLDSYQLVICRRVSKQFLEVIDNNRLLWRILEWTQQERESFLPALDMFDEHSHSSLEKVSIQEHHTDHSEKEEELPHLMQVLNRSKDTLREVTMKLRHSTISMKTAAFELVANCGRLRRMVWFWGFDWIPDTLPVSRLRLSNSRAQSSLVNQLQVLWVWNGMRTMDSKHLKSLVSFAQYTKEVELQELISKFSETIVHLKIRVGKGKPVSGPLLCPNLKVFEGCVLDGFASFFDAPKLQTLVLEGVRNLGSSEGIPSSVEEVWLRISPQAFLDAQYWDLVLLHSCPKLKILKLLKHPSSTDDPSFSIQSLLKTLKSRNQRARDGIEIDGIKIVSLQKLILSTGSFSREELDRAAKVVEEVIDLKDYPDFIEIEC